MKYTLCASSLGRHISEGRFDWTGQLLLFHQLSALFTTGLRADATDMSTEARRFYGVRP